MKTIKKNLKLKKYELVKVISTLAVGQRYYRHYRADTPVRPYKYSFLALYGLTCKLWEDAYKNLI